MCTIIKLNIMKGQIVSVKIKIKKEEKKVKKEKDINK